MKAVRVDIDERKVLSGVTAEVNVVFGTIAQMINQQAVSSMKRHPTAVIKRGRGRGRQIYVGRTPKGEPPQVRKGMIVENMAIAQGDLEVFCGPLVLPGHHTECLAILEFGDHPFMQPALNVVMPRLPEVWARSVQ